MKDLRGFSYPFEPHLKRQKWRLEALLIRLKHVQAAHLEWKQRVSSLREEFRLGSEEALREVIRQCDPATHGLRLQWLALLRNGIQDAERRVEELDSERESIRAKCLLEQRRIEVFNRHKESSAEEYLRSEGARAVKAADQDWLLRQQAPSLRSGRRTRIHPRHREGFGRVNHG